LGIYWYDGRPNGNSAAWEWTTNTLTLASSKDSKGAIVISVDVAEENGTYFRYLYKVDKGIHCSAGIPRPGDGATIQVYFASVDNVEQF